VDALLKKLREESARDTAIAFERMPVQMLMALRALAVYVLAPNQHDKATSGFIALLCETGSPPQLLPPYSALLRSWVTRDGSLAINSGGSRLDQSVVRNLAALLTYMRGLPVGARKAASAAALKKLARSGIGVGEPSHAVNAWEPSTVEEVAALPAVIAILGVLDREAQERGERESQSSTELRSAQRTEPGSKERAQFMKTAGLSIIMWIRHVEAHVFFISDALPRAGLSAAVVKEVVQAALGVIVRDCSSLGFSLDAMGVLTRLPPATEKIA